MAETNIAGLGGNLALPSGYGIKTSSWSATHTVETGDYTTFASGGFREFEPIITSMSGSFAGHLAFDAADLAPFPDAIVDGSGMAIGDLQAIKATITLTATTGCTFAGTAIITNVVISRAVDSKVTVTGDFQFTGPITQTWDEGA